MSEDIYQTTFSMGPSLDLRAVYCKNDSYNNNYNGVSTLQLCPHAPAVSAAIDDLLLLNVAQRSISVINLTKHFPLIPSE